MAQLTRDRTDRAWLDDHAHEWVDAGLISSGQADAIMDYEHEGEVGPPQRFTIVAEVASYLGSVIAFAGGAAIVGPNWEDLGLVGQGAVALAIAAIGFTVGAWLVHLGEAGTTRLGSFLWVVGTGGVALFVGGVVNEIDPAEEAWFPALIGLAVLAVGASLWRNLDRPLQLLTAGTGLALAGGGLLTLTDLSLWIAAPIVWVASFVFAILAAFDRARPRLVALAVASAGLMVGSFMFADQSERLASIVAVATAAIIVTYALLDRSWPLVAIGVAAFFIAVTSLMQEVLQGTVARLVAVVLGLVVVAAVAIRAQRAGRAGPPPGG